MKMKKLLAVILVIVLAMGSLAACGGNSDDDSKGGELTGTISLDGSTSMEKLAGTFGEAFMEEHDGVKVTYNPTGSSSGIQAVMEGRCDIGLASRGLKDEEAAEGLEEKVVAIDGIAIIVHPENPISDLSIEDIKKVYTGEVKNWKELGGANAPIVLIGREAGSGTRDGFEDIADAEDACKYTQELTSTGDVVQTVAGNPNAIGYASWTAISDNVKDLTVDGVKANKKNIQSGEYKMQRNFYFVTASDKKLSEAAQAFYDFALSEAADELIELAGAVPVKR